MTTQFLLALILAGVLLHTSLGAEKGRTSSSESEVKYRGPVVYTNLPPPVLYFPRFPERPPASLLSKRGDTAAEEGKRVEYVPYPYKDLPLLVYQSESQPPVHVVQKGTTEADEPYQSGPAVYRQQSADEQKYINVGLTTATAPPVDPSDPQYISIGLTAVQPQQQQQQQHLDTVSQAPQQQQATGPAIVYYHPGAASSTTAYSSSSSGSDSQAQAHVPVEQLTQLIQNYLLQHSGIHQAIASYPSGYQPDAAAYEPVSETTTGQAVGITIIRQPGGAQLLSRHPQQQQQSYEDDVQPQQYVSIGVYPYAGGGEYGTDQQNYYNLVADPYANPNEDYRQTTNEDYRNQKEPSSYQPMNDEYRQTRPPYQTGSDNYRPVKQQSYQSVNEDYRNPKEPPYQAAPMNDDYRQAKPAYPEPANENYRKQPYQNMNEDYRNPNQPYQNMNDEYRNSKYHGPEKTGSNNNPQTTGYQVISIDLSALRSQQNAAEHQQRNVNPTYNQHPEEPPIAPPPQNYRHPNEKDASHGGREKAFQQILIQIPHKILSEPEKPVQHARAPNETPYTGTAQVANVVGSKSAPAGRPLPPPQMDKARHPKVHHVPPQGGLLPNGINIAIIKQTDSTSNAPVYKSPSDRRPQYQPPVIRNPSPPRPSAHHRPVPPREPPRQHFGLPNRPPFHQQNHNVRPNAGRDSPIVARTPYHIPVMGYNHKQQQHQLRIRPTKSRLPNFHPGHPHPGIFASSNLHFTTITPDGSKPPPVFVPPTQPFLQHQPAKELGTFMNNIPNGPFGGDINFDEINAFLNPNYDLFGSMTNGPDKKKVEEETKFLQKVTSDLLTHELNAAAIAPPTNVPFPYKYWEQPPVRGPPGAPKLQTFYSHLQHPHIRGNKRFPTIGKGSGRNRGLGKGLRRKLSALRSSIRGKSKIAPRAEEDVEDGNIESSVPKIASLIAGTKAFGNISPRQTGLDGVTIPLNPDHVLSSRISTDEDTKGDQPMPPIIVYKGFKPPVEVYGSKDDIETISKDDNRTVTNDKETASTENPVVQASSQESAEKITGEESAGYADYMYSLLPDLIRSSLNRRLDGDKWLPVGPIEYALAEDSYDRNETTTTTTTTTPTPKVPVEGSQSSAASPQYSSSKVQESIKENIEELFSLLGKEEKSDLDKE